MKLISHHLQFLFLTIPLLAWNLSDTRYVRFGSVMLALRMYWFVCAYKVLRVRRVVPFVLFHNQHKLTLDLHQPMDLAALAEIYVNQEYRWQLPFAVESVLDLGAHWGDTASYYAVTYPQALVCCVEPAKESFDRLKQTVKQFGNVRTLRALLGETQGRQKIFVSEDSLGNSVVERNNSGAIQEVQAYTLKGFAEQFGVAQFDVVKFDIEGAEACLFTDPSAKEMARAFIGEIHYDLMSITRADIEEYFAEFHLEFTPISDTRCIVRAVRMMSGS